jgi:hypothetical protein
MSALIDPRGALYSLRGEKLTTDDEAGTRASH